LQNVGVIVVMLVSGVKYARYVRGKWSIFSRCIR